jgi:uncharacterized protein YigE (DUF2233 family)
VEAEVPPITTTITLTPTPWERLAPGVEQRLIPYSLPEEEEAIVYLYALRLEPSRVTFQVRYDREQPRYMDEWLIETGVDIVLNAGFFSGNNTPVGRIVMGGDLFGFPLNYGEGTIGVAGLFTVLAGEVELYAIGRASYTPRGMSFDEAVESYPMLVLPGRQPVYPTETGERARRTVIGLDDQRRVIILVSDLPVFSLHELAGWLAQSDLNLDSALNLDGGRSSGLMVGLSGGGRLISSYVPLPIIIAIEVNGD